MSSNTSPDGNDPPDADARGMERDWPYLDDLVSAVVLLSLALSVPIGAAGVALGVIDVDLGIDMQFVGNVNIAWIFYALVVMALLDVYGRRRARAGIRLIGRVAAGYNPQDQERDQE